jgi:zinc/manganese transport system permease protein
MNFMFLADSAARHALLGAFFVSLGSAPLGVFLVLRRMSLMGDVMAHAILPGVAAVFVVSGMSLTAMSLGGVLSDGGRSRCADDSLTW